MNNSRDIQFAGFAKLLWEELENHPYVELGQLKDCDREQLYRAIARRAYDLAMHVLDNSRANNMEDWQIDKIIPYVPDMTELPDEQDSSMYWIDLGGLK